MKQSLSTEKINFINYGRHFIDSSDAKQIALSLSQERITTGNYVDRFEKNICSYLNVKFSVVCNNGTSAIHLAIMSLNLKKGDIIIMPSINFISSYSMSQNLGLKIYLADINTKTGQMDPENVEMCIKKNKIKKLSAIITMYLGGFPENVIEFYKLKKKYNCFLIEDACHAFGADYKFNKIKKKIGCCSHSDLCTFSFHPLKSITTGEGGAVTTNKKELYNQILQLRSHGIIRSKKNYNYNINRLGYNYRLSDINCALGTSQLKKIKTFIKGRKIIFNLYKNNLKDFKDYIKFPKYSLSNINSSFHLVIIYLPNFKIKEQLIKYMRQRNIILQYHYIPIYKFKFFSDYKKTNFRNSETYFKTAVSLPIYYGLSRKQQIRIIAYIKKFIKQFQK
jgi:dTDP-4-amino-4,6-dideoxygalactose transaminase